MRRVLLALGLALLAACDRGSAGPALRLSQPSALAVFSGYTDRHADLWPYAAVANAAQDELILFDAVEDRVVAAPILIRPLSIPVGAPRPALLAAARFPAPEGQPERPSLLVAVSAGSSALQLIRTWHAPCAAASCPSGPGLADEEPVDLGSVILAVAAAPAVDASGAPIADRARVVAALVGGDVAVVDYQWTGDPALDGAAGLAPSSPVTRRTFDFEGLSLAIDPRDPRFAYAASLEPIDGVQGVAQLDLRGTTPSLALRAIDARAPTRLVAAFTLRERALDRRGAYDQTTQPAADQVPGAFQPERVARVYAWRDPGGCGPTTDVACGIAVLDPAAGDVLEDPWNPGQTPKRYLAPITLPSRPVAMIVGPPAEHPPAGDNARPPGTPDGAPTEFMMINPLAARLTTGVLLLPSEDGRSYFADLARWETPSAANELAPSSGVGASSFRPSSNAVPRIGFYRPSYLTEQNLPEWEPGTNAATYLQLTPGFTPSDDWSVTFQGYLPDFASSRAALVEAAGSDRYRVSFQAVPPGSTTPTQVVNVYDPAYGVRVGDIVEFWTDPVGDAGTPACPDTRTDQASSLPPIEGKIIAIEPPSAATGTGVAHPGGTLVVQRGDCVPVASGATTSCDDQRHGPYNDPVYAACWGQLAGARQARIRAGSGTPGGEDFVVVGAVTGYAGRAASSPLGPDEGGPAFPTFTLSNAGEATLACPLIPYPSNPADVVTCEGACRTACEQAAIARRARRLHNTSLYCYQGSSSTSHCQTYFGAFDRRDADAALPYPPPEGPALAFSLGWKHLAGAETQLLVRDTRVTFHTRSGRVPSSRWGGGGNGGVAGQPTGGAWFDRTADASWNKSDDRYRFFVPHVGNLVLDLSPAWDNNNTRILR